MKKTMVLCALVAAALSPVLAHAENQGSVSFLCHSDNIDEVNLAGITFPVAQLAVQGYSVSVAKNVLTLSNDTQSIVIGTLQPRGNCSFSGSTETSFVNFTNVNMVMSLQVVQLSGCIPVTTDGVYGIQEAMTVSLNSLDKSVSMELQQAYTVSFNGLPNCQAAQH